MPPTRLVPVAQLPSLAVPLVWPPVSTQWLIARILLGSIVCVVGWRTPNTAPTSTKIDGLRPSSRNWLLTGIFVRCRRLLEAVNIARLAVKREDEVAGKAPELVGGPVGVEVAGAPAQAGDVLVEHQALPPGRPQPVVGRVEVERVADLGRR